MESQVDLTGDGYADFIMLADVSMPDLYHHPAQSDGTVSAQPVAIPLLAGESVREWRDIDQDGRIDRIGRVNDDYVWVSGHYERERRGYRWRDRRWEERDGDWVPVDGGWITVGPANQNTAIVLTPPAADPGITAEERRTITEMMAKGTYGHLVLATHDLDGTFDKLQASGAEVVQEPTLQPYGIRDCAFRDPAGNLIRINQLERSSRAKPASSA